MDKHLGDKVNASDVLSLYWEDLVTSLPLPKEEVIKGLIRWAKDSEFDLTENTSLFSLPLDLAFNLAEYVNQSLKKESVGLASPHEVLKILMDTAYAIESAGNYYARTNEVEKANSSLSPRMNSFSSLNKYEQLSAERRQVMELVRVMQKHAESRDLSDYSAKGAVQEYLKSLWTDLESGLSYEDLIKEWSGNAEA